ncbi:MAG: hypothetical protein JWR23_1922 [Mucilaginibacter sp.]|nr:hypothetical protein [Mucilaginibacter sp.]
MWGVLIIISAKGYSRTLGIPSLPTFTINEGTAIVLHGASVNALAYQWHKDGTEINGAKQKVYSKLNSLNFGIFKINRGHLS